MAMFRRITSKENFLDFIPIKSDSIRWEKKTGGNVVLLIDRNNWLDRLVRRFYNTPAVMRVELDTYGSFIWQTIDGRQTIAQICWRLKSTFGNEVEPLYQRFATYIKILKNNEFITF